MSLISYMETVLFVLYFHQGKGREISSYYEVISVRLFFKTRSKTIYKYKRLLLGNDFILKICFIQHLLFSLSVNRDCFSF